MWLRNAGRVRYANHSRQREARATDFGAVAAPGEGWRSEPEGWHAQHRLENPRPNPYHQPEKMLMLAVLEDAIFCFRKLSAARDLRQKTIFRDARNWLWSDRMDWPFSYRNVRDVLGIDANYLRQGLVRWQETLRPAKIMRGKQIDHRER